MLVFRGGVIEVLGGEDEGGEKDAVAGTWHALGHLGQAGLEAGQVDEGAEQGRDLHVAALDEARDEGFEAGEVVARGIDRWVGMCDLERVGRRVEGGGRGGGLRGRRAVDDVGDLVGEVDDHVLGDGALDEIEEGGVVDDLGQEAGGVTAQLGAGEAHGSGRRRRDGHGHGGQSRCLRRRWR